MGAAAQVEIYGVRLQAITEGDGLRLSRLEVVSTREAQKREAMLTLFSEVRSRRRELAEVTTELADTLEQLGSADDEDETDELYQRLKQQKAIKKRHEARLEELEAMSTVVVEYRVTKTGVTDVLPASAYVRVDFLERPVCWCPLGAAPPVRVSHRIDDTQDLVEEVPVCTSGAAAGQTTAAGRGLVWVPSGAAEAEFVVTARDSEGARCSEGGDIFCIEACGQEVKQTVADNGNGTYGVTYCVPGLGAAREFSLSVLLRGEHIAGSPFGVALGVVGAPQLAGGWRHTVVVMEDGSVRAFGRNVHGQLGDGSTVNRSVPITLFGEGGVRAVACGVGHTVLLMEDGSVRAFGYNTYGIYTVFGV